MPTPAKQLSAVYVEEVILDRGGSNSYWNVCQWNDDGLAILASYGNYENAMLHAMSLAPDQIHRGKRTILDQIDIDGARSTVCLGSLDVLDCMRRIRQRE